MRDLTGPRLPPLRGAATHLVVLVHGYGADGNDLMGLAPAWQPLLPGAAFVAPNGPEPCAGAPMGFQWFGISRLDPGEMAQGVERAAPVLNAFVDAELQRLGLAPDRLALVGFSQGTMMSLHVGLRRPVPPAVIVGYSGVLAANEGLAAIAPAAPPILLIHGEADPMIPYEALFASATALGRAGAAVQWHVSPGIGHAIDEEGLTLGGQFLARALSGAFERPAGPASCPV